MPSALPLIIAGGVGLAAGAVLTAMVSHARWRKQVAMVRRAERRARSAERLAELGSMTSGLAHEIKNPLSTIGLNIQLLAEALAELEADAEERGRLERRVGTLQREIERLRDILTDFLDFAGEKKLSPAPTDLNAMIDELADFFHPQAERQKVRIFVTPASQHVEALVDGPLIKQAVLNLLLNALQAMGEPDKQGSKQGTREIYMRTELGEDDGHPVARLRVADTGPGMDSETVTRIFTPYFTTKSGGTGLGLPTSRRIVEEHGGRIEVHSEQDRGTEFTLVLPVPERPE
ncbi:MAG: sensor histidine kinase [Phycisphaerales bacterium JB061]